MRSTSIKPVPKRISAEDVLRVIALISLLPLHLTCFLLHRVLYPSRHCQQLRADFIRWAIRYATKLPLSVARRLLQRDPDELLNSTRFARFQHNIWQPVQKKSFSGVWVCNGPPRQSLEPCSSDLTILFFHGGGYVLGSPAASAPTLLRTSELAAESQPKLNISTFALQYSLAPEHGFPTQLNEAVAAYHYLIHDVGIQPRELVVLGTSAGGHLALCFVRKLQELGFPQIGGLFLLSPWVSLTHSSKSFQINKQKDTITRKFLEKARNRFIGVERTNKEAEVVLDFSKDRIGGVKWGDVLPQKTFVSVGGDEALLDDILEFVSAARRDGSYIHLHISERKQTFVGV